MSQRDVKATNTKRFLININLFPTERLLIMACMQPNFRNDSQCINKDEQVLFIRNKTILTNVQG